MKSVKIAELKDHLSEHLRAVEAGAEVLVTDRERPIARIVPVTPAHQALVIVPPSASLAKVRSKRYQSAGWAVESGALLAEERGER